MFIETIMFELVEVFYRPKKQIHIRVRHGKILSEHHIIIDKSFFRKKKRKQKVF